MANTVFVWVADHDHIIIEPDKAKTGDPCLEIPNTKEAIWDWCRTLMEAVENGELDVDLPGRFLQQWRRNHSV